MQMKRVICMIIVAALLIALSGCAAQEKMKVSVSTTGTAETILDTTQNSTVGRKLQFSTVEMEQQKFKVLSDVNADFRVVACGLSRVDISLQGDEIPVGQAIQERKVTPEELFCYARLDAQNGYCQERYASLNGLTHFCYTYPECDLCIVYDVYETPDGRQTLINELSFYTSETFELGSKDYYIDESSPWSYFLDRENWGLTFAVTEASATEITVDYTHEKNQEIGQLWLEDYALYDYDPDTGEQTYLTQMNLSRDGGGIELTEGGTFRLNWEDTLGVLEEGKYVLRATVSDHYDPEQVHPLMENFYDKQSYHMTFEIFA